MVMEVDLFSLPLTGKGANRIAQECEELVVETDESLVEFVSVRVLPRPREDCPPAEEED
jgi:hypothetical protein